MKASSNTSGRKATNVTIEATLLARAKALNINISQASERGVAAAVAARDAEEWLKNNQEAIASSNAHVEKQGLPLARFRNF
jgi:antitoxin CcdA